MTAALHFAALLAAALFAPSDRPLEVTQAGPVGEIAELEEAREVRVVFSEPMVALGRIPQPVQAPFLRIVPAIPGSFRWSGTNTLIFTPAEPARLPFATRYEVTVDPSAESVAGRRLARPYTFSFTTPTVRLLQATWQRKGGRHDQPVLLMLRFNQPVTAAVLLPHLQLRYVPHPFEAPLPPPAALERMTAADSRSVDDFQAKVVRARAAAGSRESVAAAAASDWDRKAYPPADDLVVLETASAPPPDAWLSVSLDAEARGTQGTATPGKPQEKTLKLEPTFFVSSFRCQSACDPDDYNPLRFRGRVNLKELRPRVEAADVTDPARAVPLKRARRPEKVEEEPEPEDYDDERHDRSTEVALDELGYSLAPARSYAVKVDRGLVAADGQTLGYTWVGLVENWHRRAFTSFGAGHGVWEASGGPQLPFYAQNLESVTQWLAPIRPEDLMPTARALQDKSFTASPPGSGTLRRLNPAPDQVQSFGLNLAPILSDKGTGLGWAALKDGRPIPKAHQPTELKPHSTLVQVTNLGISVKDSPQNTLVLVTSLDDGEPVPGARVAIRTLDNTVFWSGVTDAEGLALAPRTPLRRSEEAWDFRFIVTAEKDGDVAYVGSDWGEGIEPWTFGLNLDLSEAKPLLRGSVFSDRGVYRLGEEVHLKALLRTDTAEGIALLDRGTAVEIVLKNSQDEEVDKRTVGLGEWSSADWTVRLPAEGALGRYEVTATVAGQQGTVAGGFLVAAYRRPDFRVDVNLAGETCLAGVTLKGVIDGRYLFGAPMAGRDVRWTYSKTPTETVPAAMEQRYPEERWVFLDETREDRYRRDSQTIKTESQSLNEQGQLVLDLETALDAGRPLNYTLEGEVTDLSRQTLAGRASFRVDPAPWYIGIKRPGYFADIKTGLDTQLLAVDLSGNPTAGVTVDVVLTQVQWHAVRRGEGQGYYTWESERREVEAGRWQVRTTGDGAPLHVPVEKGGYFVLKASARDAEGRSTTASVGFYVLGAGYTAWERYDHNRIDLVPEKKTYRPGETARIMVKSPWEKATALLTTEREGVRSHRTFRLSSTQETVEVPVTEADIPNLYVSVLLVKGRTGAYETGDASDPGKPAYRVGYAELKVEDAAKRLDVTVKADREEYRPAARARIDVAVKGGPAEVTLWAVDYGVLSLTAYKTPDVLRSVWVEKALQVLTEDSRQNIISRRVMVSKGAGEGGGGGADEGASTAVRKDFRVLAFWLGSLVTDAQGNASTVVTLPESLTTYRIMAVAADKASRFGWAEREIRISKPVLLKAAFPRFLAVGDKALFGAVVHSQLKDKGTAIVTMRSLDPALLDVQGDSKTNLPLGPKGSAEARFQVRAKAVGKARLRMTVKLLGETDAFEETLPVEVLASPEVVAAYGQANPAAREALDLPAGVVPSFGGLRVETASTALVGLGEGARYLVEYPYGCAEQLSSAALALLLAADLGEAFRLPGIEPADLKGVVGNTFHELEGFQCGDGGFGFWKGDCDKSSPYLSSYVLHVLGRGRDLGHPVWGRTMERGHEFLEKALGEAAPNDEGWRPAYTAWQAFAVKVLSEGGRPQDSHVTRLFGLLDRMPVFAMTYLLDGMTAAGEKGERPQELLRRIRNAVLPEGGTAHVEELSDPYLLWFWNSNERSTALALGALVRHGADADPLVPGMVRWLLKVRKQGRWGNTQENAAALEALVDYYKKYEAEVPDFRAVVSLSGDTLASPEFRGRSSEAQVHEMPMPDLLAKGRAGQRLDLDFKREGTGVLHYMARLKYAVDAPMQDGLDQGFRVDRSYAPGKGEGGPITTYRAGDLVKVTLTLRLPKERRFVAVTDPLPAGVEPVESWFATTAADLAREQEAAEETGGWTWWERGGFDHVERHDDRVLLFATRLAEGEHTFTYVVRATTAGTFKAAPTHAEEMYEPEVFGRTPSAVVTVKP